MLMQNAPGSVVVGEIGNPIGSARLFRASRTTYPSPAPGVLEIYFDHVLAKRDEQDSRTRPIPPESALVDNTTQSSLHTIDLAHAAE